MGLCGEPHPSLLMGGLVFLHTAYIVQKILKINLKEIMRNLDSLKKQIAHHEGFESRVYKCPNGYDTIGYGFAIKDLVMDREVADLILDGKINNIIKSIGNHDDWSEWFFEKPKAIQEVLINMIFQIGFSGVRKFRKTIQYIKDDNFLKASEEMLDSKWAKSDSPNRAKELSEIVKSQ